MLYFLPVRPKQQTTWNMEKSDILVMSFAFKLFNHFNVSTESDEDETVFQHFFYTLTDQV